MKREQQEIAGQTQLGAVSWTWGKRTGVVAILNATPDSFSDGGAFPDLEAAVARGKALAAEGADIVDIGGESTRPGFTEVSTEEEIRRVLPIIEALSNQEAYPPISIDTTKPEVAQAALNAGAALVNDIWGFVESPRMAEVVAEAGATCILMHNSRKGWRSEGVLDSIRRYWEDSVSIAQSVGVEEDRIILDPGIGFTDTREQDLTILRGIKDLKTFGFPLVIGASRKRVTGMPLGLDLDERLETTLATSAVGAFLGADFVRVHDVRENVRAVRMADLIRNCRDGQS